MKKLLWAVMFLVCLGQCTIGLGQTCPHSSVVQTRKVPLIVEREIQRFGLTRTWFNQVAVNKERNKIKHFLLQDNTFFVVTDDARLHVIDAESGATLWTASLGEPDSICLAPAANSRMVGVMSGTTLMIFERFSGRKLWENTITAVVGPGCVLSEHYVFVPLANGRILVWPLEEEQHEKRPLLETEASAPKPESTDPHDRALAELELALANARESLREQLPPAEMEPLRLKPPVFIPREGQSFGQVLVQPVVATQTAKDEYLAWPTDKGDVYFGSIGESFENAFTLLYQVRISPQGYSFGSSPGVSIDWVANRGISDQLVYSPKQVFPKPPKATEESAAEPTVEPAAPPSVEPQTAPAAPAAMKSKVRSKLASPQDTEEGTDIFGTEETAEPEQPATETAVPDTTAADPVGPGEQAKKAATPGTPVVAPAPESTEDVIPSMVLAGNAAGFVVAINDLNGEVLWKFVATHPIVKRVAIIKDHVYVCTLTGGMHCLDARNGVEQWYTHGIAQFIAESSEYLYTLNTVKEIAILDKTNGRVITTIPALSFDFFVANLESDRIYLGTNTGLIQCLRETNLADPIKHRLSTIELAQKLQEEIALANEVEKPKRPAAAPAATTEKQTDSGTVPDFGGETEPAIEDSPFGGSEEAAPAVEEGGAIEEPTDPDSPF